MSGAPHGAAITALLVLLGWSCGGGGFEPTLTSPPSGTASRVVDPQGDASSDCRPAMPCSTIARAAQVAQTGEVVVIRPGTYTGEVRVAGSGTPDRPIVFTAETPGTVVLVGHVQGANWGGGSLVNNPNNPYVTWRGLIVRNPADGVGRTTDCLGGVKAFLASQGWRLENNVIEQGQSGIWIQGDDVVIEGNTFQDLARYAVEGTASRVTIRNNIIRRINTAGTLDPACGAVTKIVYSDRYLIEGNQSYDNVGPGFWLDWDNKNYIVRNNTFRDNRGRSRAWQGAGLWLEGNPASNGKVYGNTFADNTGAGVGIFETEGVEVYENTFVGNPAGLELRNVARQPERVLRDIHIHDNRFDSWTGAAIKTSVGSWAGWSAATHNVRIDGNTYTPQAGLPIFSWLGRTYATVDAVCDELALERQACGDP